MRQYFAAATLVLVFGSSPAHSAESDNRKNEFAAMLGSDGEVLGGRISYARYLGSWVGIEPNVVVEPEDAVFSLDLVVNLSRKRKLVPYVGGGAGVCIHGSPFFDVGGGLRIRLSERLSLRGEFRYLAYEEDGVTYGLQGPLVGISYSF